MTPRHSIVCASYLILLRPDSAKAPSGSGGQVLPRGGEVLLLERKNSGWMDGWYTFPAGHVEHNESPLACAIREAREEVGVVVDRADVRFVQVISKPLREPDRLSFFFLVERWSGEPRNAEPEKCGGLLWSSLGNLPTNLIPLLRKPVEALLSGLAYDESMETEE